MLHVSACFYVSACLHVFEPQNHATRNEKYDFHGFSLIQIFSSSQNGYFTLYNEKISPFV